MPLAGGRQSVIAMDLLFDSDEWYGICKWLAPQVAGLLFFGCVASRLPAAARLLFGIILASPFLVGLALSPVDYPQEIFFPILFMTYGAITFVILGLLCVAGFVTPPFTPLVAPRTLLQRALVGLMDWAFHPLSRQIR